MQFKKPLAALAASCVLTISLATPAAAASRSGTAQCPALVVGAISAYSEQRVPTNFMYLKVGSTVKSGTGHPRFDIDTSLSRAFWYAESASLRTAAGFCNPR